MVAHRKLPRKLLDILKNPRVRKVGRMVNSDLKQLELAIGSPTPFLGALDLANYAKERHVVATAKCSLADLCATILRKRLNKNLSERRSAAWENVTLSPEQLNYAACDAYVPLLLYHKLSKFTVPKPLPLEPIPTTPVLLYSTDNTVLIASGQVSPHPDVGNSDGVKLSQIHTLVNISKVYVPAAIVSSHRKRALNSFGPPPFSVVCLRSHLRIYDPLSFHSPITDSDPINEPVAEVEMEPVIAPGIDVVTDADDVIGEVGGDDNPPEGVGSLLHYATNVDGAELETTVESSLREVDLDSQSFGQQTLSTLESPGTWDGTLRSRVLKDVFHVFNMLRLSTSHGLRKEFARVLRDAIFVPDREDRMRISAWASCLKPPKTFESLQMTRPAWLWKRCRRVIPPPNILFPLIERLFATYGPLKDSTTNLPLFNRHNWKTARGILELIRQGYVSDPPGISLYTVIGLDSKAGNLPIYRCARGTNFTEGGVHTHLLSRLPLSGVSVRHLNACLCDFVLQHNLRVCSYPL